MNDKLIRLVHQAVQGDRSATRAVIDTFKGLVYALSFKKVRSFPSAEKVARRAWSKIGGRLHDLREPDKFLEIIAWAVDESVTKDQIESSRGKDFAKFFSEEEEQGHSIMKTAKVKERRLLRDAYTGCRLPEAPVFFMRYVEGVALKEIAKLYGTDEQNALDALQKVSVDIAVRMNGKGDPKADAGVQNWEPTKISLAGFEITDSESGLSDVIRSDVEAKLNQDHELKEVSCGVRKVVQLATTTFGSHRLPEGFTADVLKDMPYVATSTKQTHRKHDAAHAKAQSQRVALTNNQPAMPYLAAGIVGALVGGVAFSVGMEILSKYVATWNFMAPVTMVVSIPFFGESWLLWVGMSLFSLIVAFPRIRHTRYRMPVLYFLYYGLMLGGMFGGAAYVLMYPFMLNSWAVSIALMTWLIGIWGLLTYRFLALYRFWTQVTEQRIAQLTCRLDDLESKKQGSSDA